MRRWLWLVGYLVLVAGLRVVRGRLGVDLVWWGVGGVVGWLVVEGDRLIYVWFLAPHEQLSQQVQYLAGQRRFREVVETLNYRGREQRQLVFRTSLAAVAWMVMAIFAVTSSGSLFGSGVVMGLGWRLVTGFWQLKKTDPELLNYRLFWPIKRLVSQKEQEWFLRILTGVFGLLTLMLL